MVGRITRVNLFLFHLSWANGFYFPINLFAFNKDTLSEIHFYTNRISEIFAWLCCLLLKKRFTLDFRYLCDSHKNTPNFFFECITLSVYNFLTIYSETFPLFSLHFDANKNVFSDSLQNYKKIVQISSRSVHRKPSNLI